MAKNKDSYTESLKELEIILAKIESGELTIDELNIMVKKAAELVKKCKEKLRNTEEEMNNTLNELD